MNELEVENTLRDLIRRVSPRPVEGDILREQPLGETGVGLDSISRVELLAGIDGIFRVLLPVELVADGSITFGSVVRHILSAPIAS